jgi:uncharacterized glyoxalase superfamily protein PhnB
MTDERVQVLRGAPYFPVNDVATAADYYERVFGFVREYFAPPHFAIVARDGQAIMLRLVPPSERIMPNEKQGGTWDAFFWVRNVDGLCAELTAKGADIVYGPMVQESYRMREFAARDPNGYVLGFGEPL